jgi:hypothetical protein
MRIATWQAPLSGEELMGITGKGQEFWRKVLFNVEFISS